MVKKGAIEKKRISYSDISKFTGIGVSTLSRLANNPEYIKTDHIEKLCEYFNCIQNINQFISIIPDKK